MNTYDSTYIDEASIIPQNFAWRPEISQSEINNMCNAQVDPGISLGLSLPSNNKPKCYPMPVTKRNKEEEYWDNVLYNIAPVPSFGEPKEEHTYVPDTIMITDAQIIKKS